MEVVSWNQEWFEECRYTASASLVRHQLEYFKTRSRGSELRGGARQDGWAGVRGGRIGGGRGCVELRRIKNPGLVLEQYVTSFHIYLLVYR